VRKIEQKSPNSTKNSHSETNWIYKSLLISFFQKIQHIIQASRFNNFLLVEFVVLHLTAKSPSPKTILGCFEIH